MRYLQIILGIWLSYLGVEAFWRYLQEYHKMGHYGSFYIIFHALMLFAGIALLLRASKPWRKPSKRKEKAEEYFF